MIFENKNINGFKYKYSYFLNTNIKTEYFDTLEEGIRSICENILLDFYQEHNIKITLYDKKDTEIFIIKKNDYEKAYTKLMLNMVYNVYEMKEYVHSNIIRTKIYMSYNKEDAINFSKKYIKENPISKNIIKPNIAELFVIDASSERFNENDKWCLYKLSLLSGHVIIDYDLHKKTAFDLIYLEK